MGLNRLAPSRPIRFDKLTTVPIGGTNDSQRCLSTDPSFIVVVDEASSRHRGKVDQKCLNWLNSLPEGETRKKLEGMLDALMDRVDAGDYAPRTP